MSLLWNNLMQKIMKEEMFNLGIKNMFLTR